MMSSKEFFTQFVCDIDDIIYPRSLCLSDKLLDIINQHGDKIKELPFDLESYKHSVIDCDYLFFISIKRIENDKYCYVYNENGLDLGQPYDICELTDSICSYIYYFYYEYKYYNSIVETYGVNITKDDLKNYIPSKQLILQYNIYYYIDYIFLEFVSNNYYRKLKEITNNDNIQEYLKELKE